MKFTFRLSSMDAFIARFARLASTALLTFSPSVAFSRKEQSFAFPSQFQSRGGFKVISTTPSLLSTKFDTSEVTGI